MTAPPMAAEPVVVHDGKCPWLLTGGSARSACLCTSRSGYAVRPKPARFLWLPDAIGTRNTPRKTAAAPVPDPAPKVTSRTLMAEAGVDWETVRIWGREHGQPADHTKPLVPSLRCVTAYIEAHKPT